MNPDDAINASAMRISDLRGSEMRLHRTHACRMRDCLPMCEMDLVNQGKLHKKIIDSRVYVCIYQKIHVCSPDQCIEYRGRQDGVCPVTGLYHGQLDPDVGYVQPEKRTARVKPGLSVMKRAMAVQAEPLTDDEKTLYSSPAWPSMEGPLKHRRVSEPDEEVTVKLEPGTEAHPLPSAVVAAASTHVLPESGFYSFGSAVVKKEPKGGKRFGRGGTGNVVGGGGGGGGSGIRKKPVPLSKRRDDAEEIVTQLLYSSVRKAINKAKKDRLYNDKLKAMAAYYKERAGITFPIMVEVEGIKAIYEVDTPSLRNLKRNEQRIEYYVNIILRTWEIVTATPWGAHNPGYKFTAHALSVMYKMRSGLKLQNLQLLPFDSYLNALPNRGDLKDYNKSYNSSIITEGMKHIKAAYESALASGWSPSALSLEGI